MADNWYAQRGEKQVGPMPLDKLRGALSAKRLRAEDLVWKEGWPEWRPAREVAELGDLAEADEGEFALAEEPPRPATPAPAAPAGRPLDYRSTRGSGGVAASETALAALRSTRPWVMMFSILVFIGLGLGALFLLIGGIAAAAQGEPAALLFMLIPLAFMLLYFFPALFLMKYATAIGRLNGSGAPEDLEAALVNQKSFWKFVGILTVVVISIYVLFFLLALLIGGIGIFGASRSGGGATPAPTYSVPNNPSR